MNRNNHHRILKLNKQLLTCKAYVFIKYLTQEDINVITTKDSVKTEHMKNCLDLSYLKNIKKENWKLMTNDKMEKGSFREPTVSSSNISENEKFQKSNQTNVNVKIESLANSTASCSSSKIIQKSKLSNMEIKTETSYSHTISSPSSSGLQSSKKSMKQKLSNEQSYSHTISSPSSSGLQSSKQSMKRKLSNEQSYSHTISSPSSSGLQSSKKSKKRKISNEQSNSHTISSPSSSGLQSSKKSMISKLCIKNESSTYLQVNGHSKNISKNNPSSENLIGILNIRNPKYMMGFSMYKMYNNKFAKVEITSIENRTAMTNPNDKIDLQLHHFTFLFDKYFSIPFQQTIVIIANIANASLLCENFYNEKKAEFQRKIFNIEIFQGHKMVLVSKLKNHLMMILLSIDEYDVYNMALILFMCMLSIIPSLRVIHLDLDDTFKDLVQLFCNNLERSQSRFIKFINCIESHTFHSNCNYLIKLFGVAARLDHTMKSRMEIFFKPKNKLTDYFKHVNRAVCQNSNDTKFFLSLVDESSRNVCDSYKFKEPQGIFLKNNPPTVSKITTNDEYKKPTYLRRLNENTTPKNTTNANLETSLESSASNITNV